MPSVPNPYTYGVPFFTDVDLVKQVIENYFGMFKILFSSDIYADLGISILIILETEDINCVFDFYEENNISSSLVRCSPTATWL